MLYQKNLTGESCDAAFSADSKSCYTGTASTSSSPIPEKWVQLAGLRFYSPELGRWLSRDPKEEEGGRNLMLFGRNSPLLGVDVLGMFVQNPYDPPGFPVFVLPQPPPPQPGSSGGNAQRVLGVAYWRPECCRSKDDRTRGREIPDVLTPSEFPLEDVGPVRGTYRISPTDPPSAAGGGGAGPCHLLVVKCSGFVATFHFSVGDSPKLTLQRFSWPSGCSAIICGGDDSDDSNCLGDDVESAASAIGLTVEGVSENSQCGVDESGDWWQRGN